MKNYWKDKKVLVTGAAGFIGSHAVDALIEKGAMVTAAISPTSSETKIEQNLGHMNGEILIKKADLLDFDSCLQLLKDQQVVLNFAALDGGMQFKLKYPAKIFQTNTKIVLNMLEAARLQNIQRFLLMSSIDIYYPTNHMLLKEENDYGKELMHSTEGYAWAKRLSELAAKMYYKQYDLPIAIARAGNVYGPRDQLSTERGRVIPSFIAKSLQSEDLVVFGNGEQKKSFLYITDLIDALLLLTEHYAVADAVNIAGKNYISIKDLATLVIKLIKSTNTIVLNKDTANSSKQTKIAIGKMKKIINFSEKKSLKKGIEETIAYYKNIK